MKYKNLLIFSTIGLFLVVCIIASIYVFRVSDVNVTINSTENNKQIILDDINSIFQQYNDESIILLNKNKLNNEIVSTNSYIKINSIKKVLPNIINVDVEERFEYFCLKYNNKFYYLDKDLFIIRVSDQNINNLGGFSNPIIEISSDNFSDSNLDSCNYLQVFDDTTKNTINFIGTKIFDKLQYYKSFSFIVKDGGYYRYSLSIEFIEGVKYNISSYNERLDDKLNKVYEDYLNRLDKSTGNYYVDINVNGEIVIK